MRVFFGRNEDGPLVALSRDGVMLAIARGTAADEPLDLFDRVLVESGADCSLVTEIAVDHGPDGFSKVRRRAVIASTLAYGLGAALCGTGPLAPDQAAELPSAAFSHVAEVHPIYDRAPNITAPKRKRLFP